MISQDGFSDFKSPYKAFEGGYCKSVVWEYKRTRQAVILDKQSTEGDCLIIRALSVVDDKGNLVQANYGKIYGPVEFGTIGPKTVLKMNYYFNPTPNDRNMEFDPSNNLFKNLKSSEEVRQP